MIHQNNRVRKKEVREQKPTTFVIIRHGQTPMNRDDEIRGWLDVPLTEKGKKEARRIGEELKNQGIDCLYVSDLKRARETAEEIHKISGIPIDEVSFWLRPWNLGKFTAHPVKEVIGDIKKYASETPLTSIPDGECFHEFVNRFLGGVMGLKYLGKKIGLVTHHRNDRVFAAWEKMGMPDNKELDLSVMFEKGIDPGTWRMEGEEISTLGSDS